MMRRRMCLLAFLAVGTIPAAALAGVYEGAGFGVNEYSSECGGSDLSNPRKDAEKFDAGLEAIGYSSSRYWKDDAVDGVDFIDSRSDHVDPYGTDWADVAFFSGHGSHNCTGVGYSKIYLGDASNECVASTNGSSSIQMRFGEGGSGLRRRNRRRHWRRFV